MPEIEPIAAAAAASRQALKYEIIRLVVNLWM